MLFELKRRAFRRGLLDFSVRRRFSLRAQGSLRANLLPEMRFGEWRAYFYFVTRWIFGTGMSSGPRHVLRWLVKFNTLGFQALIFGIHIGYVNMQLDKMRPVELIPGDQNQSNSMRAG